MTGLVSVIVPVHNGERFLGEALESALAQSYRPLEVIVTDDGSTDRSAAIARSFPGVTVLQQANLGVSAARNSALKVATGEYIAFLDADDLWLPEKLSLQVAYLQQHPEAAFVAAHAGQFVEPGIALPAWFDRLDTGAPVVGCLPSAWLVRRTLADAVGEFDTTYTHGEDIDWMARAELAGFPLHPMEAVLVRRRVHDANLSGMAHESQRGLLRALRASAHRQQAGARP